MSISEVLGILEARRARLTGVGLIVRLFILLVALLVIAPPPILVALGPQQVVHTRNPKIGVHTRLTDEVEPWKIQRTVQMVRQMGASWIVEYFPWAYSEGRKGELNFDHADLIVDHARAQGLTVIARIGMVPAWARPDPKIQQTKDSYLDEAHFSDYCDFAAAFAQHFRGRVHYIIVWNEPNISFEWGYRPVDPAAYVRLLANCYPKIKAADPQIQVLGAPLAPTLEPPGSPNGLSDVLYLEEMYRAGAGKYFDALAVHAYGLGFPADAPPDSGVLNFRRAELLRAIMEKYGDSAKRVYITESGWNDGPRWTRAVKPGARIQYTLDAYRWAMERWPWCAMVAMWAFRFPAPSHSYMDYYSFVNPDFTPRPIYEAIQASNQ